MFNFTTALVDCAGCPVNTDAGDADRGHAQRVLDQRGLRLVDILSCVEECDGATYCVLARTSSGTLVRAEVHSEPHYSDVEVVTAL